MLDSQVTKFKDIQKSGWEYYKTWMREETYSPALKTKVYITRKGWDHLIKGRSSRKRVIKDRINRLQLLRAAKHVIKTSQNKESTRNNDHEYIALHGVFQKQAIRVIIRKAKGGRPIFFSVMKE